MSLVLNAAKCEHVTHSGFVVDNPLLWSFSRVEPGDATLLGAPLFPGRVLNDFWSDQCRDLSRAVDRLSLVGRQDALILLRASFSAPRAAFAALFALGGRVRTRRFRQLTEDGTVADHQQYYVRLAVATGKFTHQVRWSWHQKSIFARITCLFGLRGNYSSVAGRDSWWLPAPSRRVGRVSERSLGGLI